MGLHFTNSALLTGSIVAWHLSLDSRVQARSRISFGVVSEKFLVWIRSATAVIILLLGVTGTVAALSTTLFPSTSLTEGLRQDLNEASHFLLRWRIYHPVLGLISAALGCVIFLAIGKALPLEEKMLRWRSQRLAYLFLATGVVGTITLFLLSPVVMKVVHLAMAYLLWISIVAWIYGVKTEFVPAREPKQILFFDGVCHLCHRSVKAMIGFDVRRALAFSPLQGELAKTKLEPSDRESLKSLVLWKEGKTEHFSSAVLNAALEGPFEIRLFALIAKLIPRFLRDAIYSFVAERRYKWFGRNDLCTLPTASQKLDQEQLFP
jgi:predicted DCC family thiol-disulfide oxidoreductase YuxK